MRSGLEIRCVAREDLSQCARVYAEAFAAAPYCQQWTPAEAEEVLDALYHRDPEVCFCAAIDGEIVGIAFCSTVARYRATVEELAVHTRRQRQGIGTALLLHCADAMEQRGYAALDLLAHVEAPAFRFYKRRGFKTARRYVLMSRDLR